MKKASYDKMRMVLQAKRKIKGGDLNFIVLAHLFHRFLDVSNKDFSYRRVFAQPFQA